MASAKVFNFRDLAAMPLPLRIPWRSTSVSHQWSIESEFMTVISVLKTLEHRGWFILGGVALWLALELGYRLYTSPVHSYSGFILELNVIKYVEAWLIYLFLLFWAPAQLRRPSDYFVSFLLFGLMTPLLIFYGLADQSREHLYIVLLGYALVDIFRRGPVLRLPVLREGPFLGIVVAVVGALVVSLWLFWSGGAGFFNLDLTAVYDYRRDVGAVINEGVMGYVNTWAYKVFGPVLLAVALWRRNWWLAGLVFTLHVYWFGVSSHKSVLLFPFLVLFTWVWFRRTKALSVVPFIMTGVVVSTLLVYLISDYGFPASMFIHRAFFIISNNTFYYYEFFSENNLVYWSNSVLSYFLEYSYDMSPARVIGDSRGTESHVNNTFLATGYMHAGVWGIVLYGILAGLIFRLVDNVSASGVPVWVAIAVLIVPSRALLFDADLPTALLTHGIAVALLILLLLRTGDRARNGEKVAASRDKGGA